MRDVGDPTAERDCGRVVCRCAQRRNYCARRPLADVLRPPLVDVVEVELDVVGIIDHQLGVPSIHVLAVSIVARTCYCHLKAKAV